MKSTQPFTVSTITVARFRLPSLRALSLTCVAGSIALVSATSLHAKPVPSNLGNGLDKLVGSHLAILQAQTEGKGIETFASRDGRAYATAEAAALAALTMGDAQGRLLVRINLDGTSDLRTTRRALTSRFASLSVTAVDRAYRGVGVMNAFVAVDDVAALAQAPGVRSVILELKPTLRQKKEAAPTPQEAGPGAVNGQIFNKLGTAFDQGVTQHRVEQINRFYNPGAASDFQGANLSVGFLSDSFDTAALNATPAPVAPTDVANFDLPGSSSNPAGNAQPIVVLQDVTDGSDEGRAMVQIGHKMAPKARLGFATAFTGEVGFANNIRALAGLPGFTFPGQNFAADVVCDDVGYGDEPFFQDGIIGNAVDDVAAAGVSYFSSASNDIGVNGYDSDLRFVPNGTGLTAAAGNAALAGTNIDLTGVPAGLYAGGFHNFNPAPGSLDVAQLVNVNANPPATVLQWNEPYDQNTTPTLVQPPLYTASGTITGATAVNFTIPNSLTQGTLYQLSVVAAPGSNVDVIVTVRDPAGNVLVNAQDTGTDEQARFVAPVSGSGYTISVTRFSTTTGAFNLTFNATAGFPTAAVATDINLLVFNAATGAYLSGSSLTADNFATNQPIEIGLTARPTGATQVQYVIARGNVPASGGANHVRYLIGGNGAGGLGPAEYFTYNTVTTRGHSMATGCNGTAAYSVFRPSVPESFTSPGPVMIYFDKLGNRLATPEVRLQPRIAAADNANTSFFVSDSGSDPDTNPNFSGTSAAAPHAAAIAALVLEAKGGRRSVTPTQMTSLLQRSTFPHDLDPASASGSARVSTGGKVVITVNSDNSANGNTGANDNNAIAVSYIGNSSVLSLVFNPQGTAATAGNPTSGNNGVLNTAGSTPPTVTYFENSFPGLVFAPVAKPFTIGNLSTIPATAGVLATYTNLAPAPSTTQSYTLTLTVPSGTFTGGNVLRFSVGRAVQRSASTTGSGATATNYLADLLGGGVSIPSGTVVNDGMTFSGTTADGGTFSGVIRNRIGAGYSPVDGFGFINAQTAVTQTVP